MNTLLQRIVLVNIFVMLLTAINVEAQIYLVGDATPGGWDLANQTEMTQESDGLYSWTGTLTSGAFKIKTYPENDFCGGDWIHPKESAAQLSDAVFDVLAGCAENNPDHQWAVSADTSLTITVNLTDSTITFSEISDIAQPELFLVGDATPGGWDLASQTPMVQDSDSIYSWTGTLTAGSFKIKMYPEQDFCAGNWIHPTTGSAPLENAAINVLEGCAEGNPDNQWSVSADTMLTIIINLGDSTIAFSEVGAEPTADLYLVGDATPGGWDLASQTQMDLKEDSVFTWTGSLSTGNFKIKTYAESDFCGGNWVHPTTASAPLDNATIEILLGCAETNPDHQWTVTSDTTITLEVNLKSLTISFSEVEQQVEETGLAAFMVGSATSGGWDLGSQTAMTQSDTDSTLFTYSDTLTVGEFKIKLYEENDFCAGDWLHPVEASQSFDNNAAVILLGCSETNPDYKWAITEPGIYTVTADLSDTTLVVQLDESFNKSYDELYMVGSATPGGWDLSLQSAMVKDDENAAVFSWTGILSAGEIKIKTYAENEFCAGEWIHPPVENAPLTELDFEILIGCADSNPDYKWVVSESDTGNYIVTVDLDSSKISFEKRMINSNEDFSSDITEYQLHQNYPNPFNPSTNIGFELPQSGLVRLNIYDMLGRKVATLIDRSLSMGAHTVSFDASNLSSGIYIYTLETASSMLTRKMMLIK